MSYGGSVLDVFGKGGRSREVAVSPTPAAELRSYAYEQGLERDRRFFPISRERVWQIITAGMKHTGLREPKGVGTSTFRITWPGRAGRPAWTGRPVQHAVPVAAWNALVEQRDGEGAAVVAAFGVRKVASQVQRPDWRACASAEEAAQRLEQRNRLLATLRPPRDAEERGEGGPGPAPASKTQVHWSAIRSRFLRDLYSLSYGVSAIGRKYFDGHEMLFPETARP